MTQVSHRTGRGWGLAAGLLLVMASGAAMAMPPVWTVKDADSQIVLFGSVHVLPAKLNWRPQTLVKALSDADDVWFELPQDPATQSQVMQVAMARGLQPAGVRLSSQLSAEGWKRLERVAARAGVDPLRLEAFKPWLAEASLAVVSFQVDGGSAQEGVEQVVSAGLQPETERRAFETAEEQIGFLADASAAEQLASLEETLRQIDEEPQAYLDLVKAWMAGDVHRLEREALDPMRQVTPALYKALILDRNRRWIKTIQQRAAGHGKTVIVVGVGHLVGPDGLPAQLRQLGFSVEGP